MSHFRLSAFRWARACTLLFVFLLVCGCGSDQEKKRENLLILVASSEHEGARVFIDGEEIGTLQRERLLARLIRKVVPQPDFWPSGFASLSIDVSALGDGTHVVRVASDDEELISRSFLVPLSEDLIISAEFPSEDGS
jgi:hypothetical protein